MQMRPTQLDDGRWAIEFMQRLQWNRETRSYDHGEFWGTELDGGDDDETFATKSECEYQILCYRADIANEDMAIRQYRYQYDYACGIRD